MMADYYGHHYFNNPKDLDEVEDEEFNLEAELAKLEADPDEWETLSNDSKDSGTG